MKREIMTGTDARPRHDKAVRRAILGLMRAAGAMYPDNYARGHDTLQYRDPVRFADLRTSREDYRAAISTARGTPMDLIDRNGYTVATPEAQAYRRARREELEARRAFVPDEP